MTKQDIIESLSKSEDLSKAKASNCLNALLDEIKKELSKGHDVVLTGFGTFGVVKRKARTGRNPRTGETIHIPAMKSPHFKAGKSLKEAVK